MYGKALHCSAAFVGTKTSLRISGCFTHKNRASRGERGELPMNRAAFTNPGSRVWLVVKCALTDLTDIWHIRVGEVLFFRKSLARRKTIFLRWLESDFVGNRTNYDWFLPSLSLPSPGAGPPIKQLHLSSACLSHTTLEVPFRVLSEWFNSTGDRFELEVDIQGDGLIGPDKHCINQTDVSSDSIYRLEYWPSVVGQSKGRYVQTLFTSCVPSDEYSYETCRGYS